MPLGAIARLVVSRRLIFAVSHSTSNAELPTLNAQLAPSELDVKRWALGVGRWALLPLLALRWKPVIKH